MELLYLIYIYKLWHITVRGVNDLHQLSALLDFDETATPGNRTLKFPTKYFTQFLPYTSSHNRCPPHYTALHTHEENKCTSHGLSHVSYRLINPLNAELNPICCLLALLGAHHFLHVTRIRVKSLTLRLLMSYIYIYIYVCVCGAPILDVSRSHTTTHHSR